MNWDAIGAIAETLGAIGVILTLVYLTTQIKQNTKALKASSYRATTDSLNSINVTIASNPELARVMTAAQAAEPLDHTEKAQFQFITLAVFRTWEEAFYMRDQGLAEDRTWTRSETSLRRVLNLPGTLEWWRTGDYGFDAEFTSLVNQIIGEQGDGA